MQIIRNKFNPMFFDSKAVANKQRTLHQPLAVAPGGIQGLPCTVMK